MLCNSLLKHVSVTTNTQTMVQERWGWRFLISSRRKLYKEEVSRITLNRNRGH
jgi:hypothetical protein